ncbi:MAG TPA: DUF4149 domain-containing protein [Burkholderiaceae bacterium]|nr:DUF4149 domain-containing protein [Burkholderiaceae bacterium]
MADRFAALLAGLWAGLLVGIGAVAAPAAFATLPAQEAGRVVGRMFAIDAYTSLAIAVVLLLFVRRRRRADADAARGSQFSHELMLLLGTLACTVGGYFAVLPMMEAARVGQGALSFGALHAISAGAFVVKGLFVLALAWRLGGLRTIAPS